MQTEENKRQRNFHRKTFKKLEKASKQTKIIIIMACRGV